MSVAGVLPHDNSRTVAHHEKSIVDNLGEGFATSLEAHGQTPTDQNQALLGYIVRRSYATFPRGEGDEEEATGGSIVVASSASETPSAATNGCSKPSIVACVTACNESREELKHCLDSFLGKSPADIKLSTVYVFLDACPDESMEATNETFQALVELMDLQVGPSGSLGSYREEGGCRVYQGMLGSIVARLYVKGRGDFQRSKRRSIIAFYQILGKRISSGASEEPLLVLHMDADTGASERERSNAETGYGLEQIAKLARMFHGNPDLGAVASQVRTLQRTKNALTLMQSFDCNTTFVGVCGGASLVGRSILCFGMTVLYRYRAVIETKISGVPSPLEALSRTPGQSLVDLVNLDMNEDQGITTFIMRAGYDTKVCMVTRFHTFSPEGLAELMGQRRRWQAGYFVGIPAQIFGSPSPHLSWTKFRFLYALVDMVVWINIVTLPGTIAAGLAFFFGEVYDRYYEIGTGREVVVGSNLWLVPRGLFTAGVWTFWLLYITLSMDRAPKKIRLRIEFFVILAAVVTVGVCAAAASISSSVLQILVGIVASNFISGLVLTHDVREWPHRLQELPFYVIFLYVVQPLITLYAVANIDSAWWGTRSVGNVSAIAKKLEKPSTARNCPLTADPNQEEEVALIPALARSGSGDSRPIDPGETTEDGTPRAREVATAGVQHRQHPASDSLQWKGSAKVGPVRVQAPAIQVSSHVKGDSISMSQDLPYNTNITSGLSLRQRKFAILILWIVASIGITCFMLLGQLYTLNIIGLLSYVVGLVFIFVSAALEAFLQNRATRVHVTHV